MTELAFLDTRVSFLASHRDCDDGISLMEHRAPGGHSPPLHVHRGEDEVFHLVEGRLTFRIGHEEREVAAGTTLVAPKGVPHTFRVDSPEGARWLLVTTGGDFERFVAEAAGRALSPDELTALAGEHGIEIVGPPLG